MMSYAPFLNIKRKFSLLRFCCYLNDTIPLSLKNNFCIHFKPQEDG